VALVLVRLDGYARIAMVLLPLPTHEIGRLRHFDRPL